MSDKKLCLVCNLLRCWIDGERDLGPIYGSESYSICPKCAAMIKRIKTVIEMQPEAGR